MAAPPCLFFRWRVRVEALVQEHVAGLVAALPADQVSAAADLVAARSAVLVEIGAEPVVVGTRAGAGLGRSCRRLGAGSCRVICSVIVRAVFVSEPKTRNPKRARKRQAL